MTLAQNLPKTQPGPGVYEAAPYSSSVIVPAELDSKAVVGDNKNLTMPMAKPELRLIPKKAY